MAASIRQARSTDSPQWLELAKAALGEDYPDKQVFNLAWASNQFRPESGVETWVAEQAGKLVSAVSMLPGTQASASRVANIGRHFARPEACADGSAEALLNALVDAAAKRQQILVGRVLSSASALQVVYEKAGFVCVGFQPLKHMTQTREGVLFYVRMTHVDGVPRIPLSDSLPQINELASIVLGKLKLPNPPSVRDGAVGYPLQTEVKFLDAGATEYEHAHSAAQAMNPPVEISGAFHRGNGYLRTPAEGQMRYILSSREDKTTGGLAYCVDAIDRCVRLVSGFATDDLSMGALFRQALKVTQEQNSAVYVEADILMTAPRLLKTAEQLGFVPIAYLPAFFSQGDQYADVVKMVKLNMVYSPETASLTTAGRSIADVVDHNFQDQKLGIAIINLLRALPIFDGLGDGELRKIARLFTQKLYRAGEKIFNKGDSGNEAYVVMRGQVDILLDEQSKPIASVGNGQIFGELAFLDGATRVAIALATQPCILLVIQRSAFNALTQREPHLGMVVMRNIAMELSNRLRKTNAAISPRK